MSFNRCAALLTLFIAVTAAEGQGSPEAAGTPARCADIDAHQAFDFWLGTWTVHLADGREAGRNVI